MSLPLETDRHCFCCGEENDRGLHLAISYPARGVAEARLVVPAHMAGWRGITHGGLLSMVLDELMAHACISAGARAVTAEMTTRFVKAVPVETEIRIEGRVARERGRVLATEGRVFDSEGVVVAQSTASFVTVSVDEAGGIR
jgi:uncharacterized protein (TIGR00369 family)